jgi:hypothetical protein
VDLVVAVVDVDLLLAVLWEGNLAEMADLALVVVVVTELRQLLDKAEDQVAVVVMALVVLAQVLAEPCFLPDL